MPLIVTTSHSVLEIDPSSLRWRPLRRGEGLYYGLARLGLDDSWVVAARCRMVSSARPPEQETGRLLVMSRRGWRRWHWQAPFPLRDMHEIAMAHGRLWVTCSHDDWVALRDDHGRWRRWRPLPRSRGKEPDVYHLNSLYFEDDRVWVLAHRRGPSLLLAFDVASALAGRTTPPLERVPLGVQAHNVWRDEGVLHTCSSAEGALVNTRGWRLETGGFPRGVARLQDGWAVGISQIAERGERDLSTGEVRLYDARWREQGRVSLPGEGLVLDVQVQPEAGDPSLIR
ncbi:hypothetical protein SAMN05421721_11736 [Ectothiorhodospira mobilis]|uniref:Uncharacterized protein n=1 Tax=Ectothiorhodospira mobilis TaxID=195064 RepID=A0A1I4SIU1_ECTMO|nr:hypothetical protein [Ectothiorhodospira mobilis]SFM64406.1 hypothetical protein SAMN05421721_11736 [Ectothiorhodospira mobilis]